MLGKGTQPGTGGPKPKRTIPPAVIFHFNHWIFSNVNWKTYKNCRTQTEMWRHY